MCSTKQRYVSIMGYVSISLQLYEKMAFREYPETSLCKEHVISISLWAYELSVDP